MKFRFKSLIFLSSVLFLGVSISDTQFKLFAQDSKGSGSSDIAATVNGATIKHQTVLDLLGRLEQETGKELNAEMRQKLYTFVLNQLIEDELVSQAAKDAKSDRSQEVLKKVKDFEERVKGLQEEQVRRWAREEFLAARMKALVSDSAIEKEVQSKKDIAEVSLSYFAVSDKKKAETVSAALKKDPKKFSEVAQKHGEGDSPKVREMPPQLVESLPQFLAPLKSALEKNSVKKGEVFSSPIQVGNSFVIFLVRDLKRPASPGLLKEFVSQEIRKRETRKIIEDLKKKAKIDIKSK